MSSDPYLGSIYDPMSLHRYQYAHQNPVNFVDPTGEFSSLFTPGFVSGLRVQATSVAVGVFVKVQYALLVSPLALPTIARIGNYLTFGVSALQLLNQMAGIMLRNTQTLPVQSVGNKGYGAWVEQRVGANLDDNFRAVDHWDDNNKMGIQVKALGGNQRTTLSEIEKAAKILSRVPTPDEPLEGRYRNGAGLRIEHSAMRIRVVDAYVKETSAPWLNDPRFIRKIRYLHRTTGVFIRVIPIRGWR